MSSFAGVLGVHDVGGVDEAMKACMPDPKIDAPSLFWEKQVHALVALISIKKLMTVDELRQGIEALDSEAYKAWGYYDKWAASAAKTLLARGVLLPADFPQYFGGAVEDVATAAPKVSLSVGDIVKVRGEEYVTLWRKPHLRAPGYIHGVVGRVVQVCGTFPDPELLAFHMPAPKAVLYRVRFSQRHLWEGYEGPSSDTVEVDVYQHWLEPATEGELAAQDARAQELHRALEEGEDHGNGNHEHGHEHEHDARFDTESRAAESEGSPSIGQNLLECLIGGLEKRGHITRDELLRAVEGFNKMGSQHEGARLVARAWVDPAFKARLLADANAAAAELGIMASNAHTHTVLKVAENTDATHNLVVCTLCSCYPLSILGPSPAWYKSRSYRARAVREPRKLLEQEFGLKVPTQKAIAVHDSTADLRCMVLPQQPPGTEGMSEEHLQSLVTRDSMIGVALCQAP